MPTNKCLLIAKGHITDKQQIYQERVDPALSSINLLQYTIRD